VGVGCAQRTLHGIQGRIHKTPDAAQRVVIRYKIAGLRGRKQGGLFRVSRAHSLCPFLI